MTNTFALLGRLELTNVRLAANSNGVRVLQSRRPPTTTRSDIAAEDDNDGGPPLLPPPFFPPSTTTAIQSDGRAWDEDVSQISRGHARYLTASDLAPARIHFPPQNRGLTIHDDAESTPCEVHGQALLATPTQTALAAAKPIGRVRRFATSRSRCRQSPAVPHPPFALALDNTLRSRRRFQDLATEQATRTLDGMCRVVRCGRQRARKDARPPICSELSSCTIGHERAAYHPRTLAPTDSLSSRRLPTPDAHPPTLVLNPKPLPIRVVRPGWRRALREGEQRSRQWGRRHGLLGTYQTGSRTSRTRIASRMAGHDGWRCCCEGRWQSGAGGGCESDRRLEARMSEVAGERTDDAIASQVTRRRAARSGWRGRCPADEVLLLCINLGFALAHAPTGLSPPEWPNSNVRICRCAPAFTWRLNLSASATCLSIVMLTHFRLCHPPSFLFRKNGLCALPCCHPPSFFSTSNPTRLTCLTALPTPFSPPALNLLAPASVASHIELSANACMRSTEARQLHENDGGDDELERAKDVGDKSEDRRDRG
ncbi:hypothetical protein BJ912DRAFT_1063818 [Pholiota molesta]|nr:hypothetical protein BJ912DRAFT_1063818 [Pholiota molesta]